MPLFSGPVQWTKSMIVPGKMLGGGWKRRLTKTYRPPYRVDRYNLTHPWFMSCSVSSSQTRTCMATPSRHHWNISSIACVYQRNHWTRGRKSHHEIGLDRCDSPSGCWRSYALWLY
jgi:hypothetical protein